MTLTALLMTLLKILIVLLALPVIVGFATVAERKILGRIQVRYGPNRAGPFGLLQWAADAVKLISKEYVIPGEANKFLFIIAPLLTMVPAVTVFALIPFGKGENLVITDVNVGLLMLVAISSMGIYGIIIGGWASNSKYSLLGALRSAAQMISYELAMGLSLVAVVMMAGSMSLVEIVNAQSGYGWFVFKQPLGFLVFFITGIAETNRLPFDMPEAEGDLGAGYHTEYSSMGFGVFQLGEYASIITVGALLSTFYFGGWEGPLLPSLAFFVLKTAFFVFCFIWIRGTLPRMRYDQLMAFGWKFLLPLALFNIVYVAGFIALTVGGK